VNATSSLVDTRVIDVEGLTVRVRIEGEGEPVLLLSGLGQPLESWDPFVASLGERRIVRFDAPGVGHSATPIFPPSMTSLATIAAAVLDAAGIDQADVVGFSLGGALAQQLAYSSPTRVRRLVLIATSCGLGTTVGRWDSPDTWSTPAIAATMAQWPSLGWHSLAFVTWSSIPFLGSLTQPTLVICGRDDVVAPPVNGRVLASRIPHARLVTLAADHDMLQPGPAAELAHVVEGFLRRLDVEPDADPLVGRLPRHASSTSGT
jgi:poly(3-hydroxyoctanoate) depolymerase